MAVLHTAATAGAIAALMLAGCVQAHPGGARDCSPGWKQPRWHERGRDREHRQRVETLCLHRTVCIDGEDVQVEIVLKRVRGKVTGTLTLTATERCGLPEIRGADLRVRGGGETWSPEICLKHARGRQRVTVHLDDCTVLRGCGSVDVSLCLEGRRGEAHVRWNNAHLRS